MQKNEIKNLSRRELLEMLIEQGKENDRLKELLKEADSRLEDRELRVSQTGTMAEAALALNGVFAAADAAAKQYLENIRKISDGSQQEYDRIIAEARQEADRIVSEAGTRADEMTAEAERTLAEAKKEAEQIIAKADEHCAMLLMHSDDSKKEP